jgi:hypothetical protein
VNRQLNAAGKISSVRAPLRWVLFLALFWMLAVPVPAEDGTRVEISCADLPIKIEWDIVNDSEKYCLSWKHSSWSGSRQITWWQYSRFALFTGGFVNVRYLQSGPHSHLTYHELEKQLKLRFRKVEEKSFDWGDTQKLEAGGRRFETRSFVLPKNRYCIGFMTRWLRFDQGWKHILVGYLCNIGAPPTAVAIDYRLSRIKIVYP